MKKIAIIGAGLSGIVLANELSNYAEITVFEKSRGVGGRMATRYADPYQFDHGAQFFTAQSKSFKRFLDPLISSGLVAEWAANFVQFEGKEIVMERQWGSQMPHYVAVPKMNQMVKFLAEEHNVVLGTHIGKIERLEDVWCLCDKEGQSLGGFDWVICALPAYQTLQLMPNTFHFYDDLRQIKMSGCFALMLGAENSVELPWQFALVKNSKISTLAVNSSKPGRDTCFSMVVHSSNEWAEDHLDDDLEGIKQQLLDGVSNILGEKMFIPDHAVLHRWRYANSGKVARRKVMMDAHEKLAACGDWCVQGKVEGAFLSAEALSQNLIKLLSDE